MNESPEYLAKAEAIELNVWKAIEVLTPWAGHMAARYNAPVQLCGSILHSPTPRDCDVRVVLHDQDFEARYRQTAQQFSDDGPTQRWIDELAKFNGVLSRQLRLPMDLQVYPASKWRGEAMWPVPIILAAPSPKWWVHNKYHPKSQAMLDLDAAEAIKRAATVQSIPDEGC